MAKKSSLQARTLPPALVLIALSVTGCRAVAFVFKAGAWTATIGILILAALVFGLVSLFRRGA